MNNTFPLKNGNCSMKGFPETEIVAAPAIWYEYTALSGFKENKQRTSWIKGRSVFNFSNVYQLLGIDKLL